MRRRLVWIQGGKNYPLKMLFEGPGGYYVGGWNIEPVFVAADPGTFDNRLLLYGITATGPGPNDWLVGGWRRQPGNVWSFVFYDHTGLIFEDVREHRFFAVGGHFSSSLEFTGDPSIQKRRWTTAAGGTGETTLSGDDAALTYGFVLPGVSSGTRLNDLVRDGGIRNYVVPSLDLTYAVFVGNQVHSSVGPSDNPWLASAAGSFTRLSTDLNAAIPRSDLIGLTLYERNQDFINAAPWPNAGVHTLTITPHTLTTGGTVTTGTPFPVAYQAPDPAAYFSWDASLWVQPSTTP